jgi:hypothetical protein
MEKRTKLKLRRKQPLIGLSACAGIRAENLIRINEGIDLLARTLQVLNVGEAMAYMAILYRERADIQCGARSAYTEDLKASVRWHESACEASQKPNREKIPWPWPASPPPAPLKDDVSCPF